MILPFFLTSQDANDSTSLNMSYEGLIELLTWVTAMAAVDKVIPAANILMVLFFIVF